MNFKLCSTFLFSQGIFKMQFFFLQWYDQLRNVGLSEEEIKKRKEGCRHRAIFKPPDTPENFWELDFPDTQQCEERGEYKPPDTPRKLLGARLPRYTAVWREGWASMSTSQLTFRLSFCVTKPFQTIPLKPFCIDIYFSVRDSQWDWRCIHTVRFQLRWNVQFR